MKRIFTLIFALGLFCGAAFAQRNPTPVIERDPIMETDAKHNLEVANQYFKLKKAYKSVIMRFEETYAAYPDFSKIDEFLYIAGMSSYYLSEGKGKQKVDVKSERDWPKFAPGNLKDNAVAYLSLLVERYPESRFRVDAEKTLAVLRTMTWASPPPTPPSLKQPK